MSAHEPLQAQPARVEQPFGSEQPSDKPLRDLDLMRRLGLGHSTFYKRKAQGQYRFLEVTPAISSSTHYSAVLVSRWLRGELRQPERFFGRSTPVLTPKRRPGRPRKSDQAVTRRLAVVHGRSVNEPQP